MIGHTDASTVNQRRPLTANMARVLKNLIEKGSWRHADLDQSEANAMRALCDRGYADWHIETRSYSATEPGSGALERRDMRLTDALADAEAEVARIKREIAQGPCREYGHDWNSTGGANAGCRDLCSCSVPVYVCTKCGDSDYGDNAEATETREKCADRLILEDDDEPGRAAQSVEKK